MTSPATTIKTPVAKSQSASGSNRPFRANPMLGALLLLVGALSLSGFLWWQARQDAARALQADFQRETTDIRTQIEHFLAVQELLLKGFEGLFNASDEVTRDDFHKYFETLSSQGQVTGFAAVAYHEIVTSANLERHLARVRRQGFSNYQIQPAGQRALYAPMLYIEPLTMTNKNVLGFDPLTVAAERTAVERARDNHSVAISARLTLAQDEGAPLPSFVMYVPIYRVATENGRQATFVGWVDAPFRMNELITQVLPEGLTDLDLQIFDDPTMSEASLLFDSAAIPQAEARAKAQYQSVQRLVFGGRSWTLAFTSRPGYGGSAVAQKPLFIAACGALLGLLLSSLVVALIRLQRRREQVALSHHVDALRAVEEARRSEHERDLQANLWAMNEAQRIAGVGTYVTDIKTGIWQGSHILDGIFGIDATFIKTIENWNGLIAPEFRQELLDYYYQVIQGDGKFHKDYKVIRPVDGQSCWVSARGEFTYDSEGNPVFLRGTIQDIDERKKAELRQSESREFIHKITARLPGCVYQLKLRCDGTLCFPYASEGLRYLTGINPEEVREDAGKAWDVTHPEDLIPLIDATMASAKDLSEWNREWRVLREDAQVRWLSGNALPQRESDGSILWHGFIADITERKETEQELLDHRNHLEELVRQKTASLQQFVEALHTSEEKYRVLLQESSDPIFSFYPDGRYSYVNAAFASPFGRTPEQIIGKTPASIFPKEEADRRLQVIDSVVKSGTETTIEVRVPQPQGDLYFITTLKPICNHAQQVISVLGISKNITQRKQTEQALHDSQLRLELAIEGADEGIWDLNLVTDELYHSPQMHKMLGYTSTEMPAVREAWNAIAHPDDIADYWARTLAHLENPTLPFEIIIRLRHRDGSWRSIQIRGRATRDESGRAIRFTGTHIDVTARKQIEDAALAASLAKSEFLANMSHEIRTPMNGVVGMVDILQQTDLLPDQHRMLGTIQRSSQALLHILNDILDYSKIEAGKLTIELIPTQLREVTEGVVQLMATVANAKSIDLSVFVSPTLPRWIVTDPARLRQVLLNLIGNAVKFTRASGDSRARVDVRVEPCVLDDGRQGIQLCVIDNGIGMSDGLMAQLFQPFTQADASTARQFGGTGLGLSISQKLADVMGGRIAVCSVLGQGSQFSVELPLQEAVPPHPIPAEPSLAGMHVLAVLDDAIPDGAITSYLTTVGAQVTLLADVQAAQSMLRQPQVTACDTVLLVGPAVTTPSLDLDLPDGVGLVRLTRHSSSSSSRGINVCVRPLLYMDLIQAVAVSAGRCPKHEVAGPDGLRPPPAPSVNQALASGRLILLAEDNETNSEVIQEQLHLLGHAAEAAQDGATALDMWRTGRYALLLTDCHMPKMDGFELTRLIRQAEPRGTRLPIIAVTANAMQGEAKRCLESGMDDSLSKPLRLKELGSMLARWLPPAPDAISTDGVPAVPASWDVTALEQVVGNNPATHRRLLDKFLLNTLEQVASLNSATAAGEFNTITNLAHKLKSASRTVGALALSEWCEQLETAGRAHNAPLSKALAEGLTAAFEHAREQIQAHLATQSV